MLFTMNTLKRNADTLERIAMCGYAEHVHSASCFSGDVLVCGMEEHIHTDACYQESPASMDMDDLDIEVDEPIVDETVEDLDLSLELDGLDLVTEDVVAEPVSNAVEEKVYSLGTGAMVSQIIEAIGMGVGLNEIKEVGAVENDEAHSGLIAVERVDSDYKVWAKKDFTEAELALILADDIYVIKLVDGIAPGEEAMPEEQPVTEDVSDAQTEDADAAELPVSVDASSADAYAGDDEHIEVPVIEDEDPVDGQDEDTVHVEDVSPEAEQQVGKVEQPEIEDVPGEQAGEIAQAEQPAEAQDEELAVEESEEQQPVEEAAEEQGEELAVEEAAEEQLAEEAARAQDEEQPAEEAGEAQGEEQPTEEQPAEEAGEAQSEEQSAEEAGKEQGEEQSAEEAGEAQGEELAVEEADEAQGEEQPAEEAAEAQNEELAVEESAEEQDEEQSVEESAEAQDEEPAVEESAEEQGEEQPAEEVAEEQGEEQPAEEAAEDKGEEQPAEEATGEQGEDQPAEEATEEQGENQPAERPAEEATEEQGEEEFDEETADEQGEEQPAEETAEEQGEEQSAENQGEDQPAEETVDEQGEEQPAEEATEEQSEEQSAEEATEEQGEEQPAEAQPTDESEPTVYTATIDLADVETYPLSLNAMVIAATPEQEEIEEEAIDGEAQEDQAEEQTILTIEYDEALLEVVEQDGDYLVTPIQSFESTQIIVNNGSRYELTLVNCVLATDEKVEDEGEQQEEARDVPVYTATIDLTDATYPLSLNEMITAATLEQGDYEEAQEDQAEEEPAEEQLEEQPTLTIDYDEALLEVVEDDDDHLITPIQSFESTQIIVTNGSWYELTLVNCVLTEEEQEEQEVIYPAQAFEDRTDYVKVSVTAPEGAFPEGTTMTVADVEDEQTITDIEETVSEDFVEVKRVHAVDISFWNGEMEIEPLVPISVVISVAEIEEQQDAVVVHVDNEGATEVVESQSEAPVGETEVTVEMPASDAVPTPSDAEEQGEGQPAEDSESPEEEQTEDVVFSADSFSVYAVVVTETIETKYIDAEGGTWDIRVGFTKEANIPAGATLAVSEVESADYLSEAEAALEGGKRVTLARFFDISIVDAEGNEVQPEVPVTVNISLDNTEIESIEAVDHVIDNSDPVAVAMHFEEKDDSISVDVKQTTETEETVVFDADGFSVWGVVYTVDFYYGDYEYHLPGKGYITLSDLFGKLEIEADAAKAKDVVFSDPELVAVEQLEDGSDWTLTSLAPFDTEEKLTVTMEDGAVYEIRVEDALYQFKACVNDSDAGYLSTTYLTKWSNGSYRWATAVVESSGNVTSFTIAAGQESADGTNLHYGIVAHANDHYDFLYWLVIHSDGTTETVYDTTLSNATQINGQTTFIAFFVPQDQHLIRFISPTNGNPGFANGTSGRWIEGQLFAYSSDNTVVQVTPTNGTSIVDWYNNEIELISPNSNIFAVNTATKDLVLHPICRAANIYRITYKSSFSNTSVSRTDENVAENGTASGSIANTTRWGSDRHFLGWIDGNTNFVKRSSNYDDRNDAALTFIPTGDQIYDGAEYTALFVPNDYILVTVDDDSLELGSINGEHRWWDNDSLVKPYNKEGHVVLAMLHDINLLYNITASPYDVNNAVFDYWTLDGKKLEGVDFGSTIQNKNVDIKSQFGSATVHTLVAHFKEKTTVTYALDQIQQVGNNSADYQHWVDVPWCSNTIGFANEDGWTDAMTNSLTSLGDGKYINEISNGEVIVPYLYSSTCWPKPYTNVRRVTQTNNGYNLLTHTFRGWKRSDTGALVEPGTKLTGITQSITLTAVWDAYIPGKGKYEAWDWTNGNNNPPTVSSYRPYRFDTNTCGFFVRLFDSTFDKGDTGTYTDCLFTSRIFIDGGNFGGNTTGWRFDFYGNSDAYEQDKINDIDAHLRANLNNGVQYLQWKNTNGVNNQNYTTQTSGTTIKMELPFPSDDFIFGRIRQWNLTASESRKIQINGHRIPQDMLTSDYFDIKWYVLKDQENSWHIDGMLIPKYAKLRATKQFVGLSGAFANAKNGYTITVTETNPRQGTTPDSHVLTMGFDNDTVTWTYRMNGTSYNRVESSGSRWTFKDSSGNLLAVVNSSNNANKISWALHHLIPMTSYSVVESGYESAGYAVTTSHVIENTPQTANLTGGADASVERVYNYPDYISESAYQTVAFANLYTEPWVMSLFKQDGNTLHGLSHVTFDLEVRRSNGEVVTGIPSAHTTNGDGQISIVFPHEAGNYTFTLTEREHEGYNTITTVSGNVSVSSEGVVTVSNLTGGVTGANAMVSVDNNNNAVVYIKNTPERVNVKVLKEWASGATAQPVTMQLLRNGVVLNGMSVVLGANEAAASPQLKVTGWEYTWTDLPAYIDGKEVTYTAREEWIGEPGGVDSIHFNLANDPSDGYADYIVYQTTTESKAGDITTVSVKMENTPDNGQLVFTKVDTGHKPVAGAVFEVYDIIDNVGQSTPKDITYTSDAQGIVTISDLSVGWYWLRERSAPVGYNAGNQPYYLLNIQANNSQMLANDGNGNYTVPTVEIVNEPFTARVKVVKEGISGLKLPGAVFSLHRTETSTVPIRGYASLTTDANGEIDLGELKQGTYWLKEITAPEGYQLLANRVAITVTDDRSAEPAVVSAALDGGNLNVTQSNGIYSISVPNEFEGHRIRIRKVDSTNSSTKLQNIVFDILTAYDAQDAGNNVQFVPGNRYLESGSIRQDDGTYKTDDVGRLYIGYLPTGTYYLLERETVAGYEMLEAPVVLLVNDSSVTYTMPGQEPVTVTNTDDKGCIEIHIPNVPHGSLKITKAIAGNSDASTDQAFTFTVRLAKDGAAYTNPVKTTSEGGSEQTVTPDANGDVTVTTTGAGEALVGDLPAGVSYEVVEAGVAGWHISASQNLSGTIAAGTQSTATVTNEQLGSLKIAKTVKVGDTAASELADAALKGKADGTYTFNVYTDSACSIAATRADGTAINPVTVSVREGAAITREITGLIPGAYYVQEQNVSDNKVVTLDTAVKEVVVAAGKTGEQVEATGVAEIENVYALTSVEVTKAWSDDAWPALVESVEVTLMAQSGAAEAAPAAVTAATNGNAPGATLAKPSAGVNMATATWTNLPVKDADGNPITYTVVESAVVYDGVTYTSQGDISLSDMFEVTTTQPRDGHATITNRLYETTLNVFKRNAETQAALPGAVFTLAKQSSAGVYEVYGDPQTSVADGKLAFQNLPGGEYRLEETGIPAGYARTSSGKYIYFKIAEGAVIWDDTPEDAIKKDNDGVAYSADENNQFTVDNTPGVSLPSTGGPGTTIIYAAGLGMIVMAIFGLVLRRRKARDVIE